MDLFYPVFPKLVISLFLFSLIALFHTPVFLIIPCILVLACSVLLHLVYLVVCVFFSAPVLHYTLCYFIKDCLCLYPCLLRPPSVMMEYVYGRQEQRIEENMITMLVMFFPHVSQLATPF